jgi:signal peptidase I
MYPSLEKGDLVWIKKSSKPRFGRVIVFTSLGHKNMKIIHRYANFGRFTVTMGDGNKYVDNLKIEKIIGVVEMNESFFKWFYYSSRICFALFSGFLQKGGGHE